jgi:uncharacterized peroxidase-related enzyme
MAHIDLGNDLPGIRGPMAFRPETARPLNELAEILLRDDNNTLSRGERELIGGHVSALNDCFFCHNVHHSLAMHYLGDAPLSDKMEALLVIAGKVQQSGKAVTPEDIEKARAQGATDREIHDTVLIAAAFCMYNRYVDGLGTWAPQDPQFYINRAPVRAAEGYIDFDLYK